MTMRISKEVSMPPPVCLILGAGAGAGAGAGIGGHVAKRFARDGYHACVARRSDQAGLDKLVAEINATGGSASGHLLNAVEEGSIEQLVTSIEADLGPMGLDLRAGPARPFRPGLVEPCPQPRSQVGAPHAEAAPRPQQPRRPHRLAAGRVATAL
jgi:NAD(P)-dependent dehydrogenase (short-subunit alcohol dehydrogenase family)